MHSPALAWVVAGAVGAAVLNGPAQAGALDDCYRRAPTQLQVTPCLNAQKKAATDEMLEQFLAVEQSLIELEMATGRSGKTTALKQSQRDFERYLQSHCQVVRLAYDSGAGAGQAQLACEVDFLRQRAAVLKPLGSPPSEMKPKE